VRPSSRLGGGDRGVAPAPSVPAAAAADVVAAVPESRIPGASPGGGDTVRGLKAEVERLREALKTQTTQCNLVGKRLLVLQHARNSGAGGSDAAMVSREEHERVVAEWQGLKDKVERKATALLAAESMCGRLAEAAEAEKAEAEAEFEKRLEAERSRLRSEIMREGNSASKGVGESPVAGEGHNKVLADGEGVVSVLQSERKSHLRGLVWALWRMQVANAKELAVAGERTAAEARRAEEEAEGLREELDYLREESEKAEIRLADELAETQRRLAQAEKSTAGRKEVESDSDEESDVDAREEAEGLRAEVAHLKEERDELMRKYQARIVELEEQARTTAELTRAEEAQRAKAGLEEQQRLYSELKTELDLRQSELDTAVSEAEKLTIELHELEMEKEAAQGGWGQGGEGAAAKDEEHAKEVERLQREIVSVREQATMEAEVREEMLRRTRQAELSALADENVDLKARLDRAEAELKTARASMTTPSPAAPKQHGSASKGGSSERTGTGHRSGRVLRSRNVID